VGGWIRSALGLTLGALSFVILIFVLNPLQMLSVLIRPFSKSAFREVNRWFARFIWGLWVVMAERLVGVRMRFTGDPIRKGENALVLSNHQTMADVMVLLAYAWRSARIGDMKWFVKDVIKWVPGPGWGMVFLDCIFLKRNWAQDRAEIERLFGKFQSEGIPIFLVSFLEGTRKTSEKHARSVAFARERGLYEPRYTMIPRTKGFVATMLGLRGHLDAVHDVTIAYGDRVPSLMECFAGKVRRVDIHLRRFAVAEVPTDEAALTAWAMQRYREKDELLAAHAETGTFPGPVRSGPVRALDWLRPEPARECPLPEPEGELGTHGDVPRSS
jgi:1-acyl-sn-glycerol-3-phosphate acyltransferase